MTGSLFGDVCGVSRAAKVLRPQLTLKGYTQPAGDPEGGRDASSLYCTCNFCKWGIISK